jgi:ketosteroid isomerase-like protein
MDFEKVVREAYESLARADVDAVLRLLGDDAKFFVPGATRISGDHDRDRIPGVLASMQEISSEGFRRDVLAVVASPAGAMAVLHEYVTRDGQEFNYHSIHDWDVRNGKVAYWWVYVHEYDQFDRAWS